MYGVSSVFRSANACFLKAFLNPNKGLSQVIQSALGSSVAFAFWKFKSDINKTPRIITRAEVEKHRSVEDGGIWVSYKNKVYDITKFVEHHPGGDQILLAAGADVQSFWTLYAFHFEDHVLKVLDEYYIGDLPPEEHEEADIVALGPYADEPTRHPALINVSKEPCNAETAPALIPDHPITQNELFFIRNHFPVPEIDEKSHRLEITNSDLPTSQPLYVSLSVEDLKKQFTPNTIITTIVCAGNRRSDMMKEDENIAKARGTKPSIRGLGWNHTAISTSQWTGVRLVDLLAKYLCPGDPDPDHSRLIEFAKKAGIRHVQFIGVDLNAVGEAFGSSLPIEWALDPHMDVMIAYEMNGEPLPRDHGFPLRVIVPGAIGARQVKWLTGINLSSEESPSFYQRQDYRMNYTGQQNPAPAILDYPVQSAICEPHEGQTVVNHGTILVRGYAFSGGGRGILSVRVSTDDGKSWTEAKLHPVSPPAGVDPSELAEGDLALEHRTRRQWAWTLWELELPIPDSTHELELVCCARDSSNATQPRTAEAYLNHRGLLTNSWHRVRVKVKQPN